MLFRSRLPWRSSEPLHCYEDPQRQRFYLVSESNGDPGYCLATDTWYLLSEIPNLVFFNGDTGMILQEKGNILKGISELYLSSMMTAEDLIAYGHTIIGE